MAAVDFIDINNVDPRIKNVKNVFFCEKI